MNRSSYWINFTIVAVATFGIVWVLLNMPLTVFLLSATVYCATGAYLHVAKIAATNPQKHVDRLVSSITA